MGYVLSEEQNFLKDSAKDLLQAAQVSLVRTLRDNKDEFGYATDVWQQMVEVGWPGLVISEEYGGLDFGLRGLGIIMEAAGRNLTASPLMTVAVAAKIIQDHGSEDQKNLLEGIATKGDIVALAVQEGSFYQIGDQKVQASSRNGGFVIHGTKDMVCDGHIADKLIVSTKTDNGVTVFLIDATHKGVSITKDFMMDSRYYCTVQLENVEVEEHQVLGKLNGGAKVLNEITNIASALISAELTGLASEAFDRTIAYLKERRQFDRAIGSFQGLQHRAADLYGEIELAKSITIKALDALDEGNFMAPAFASMAKAKCAKVAQLATNEGVQMFGGIGMTDDEEIGFFLKRARVAAQLYGSHSYHLDRFAKMNGY